MEIGKLGWAATPIPQFPNSLIPQFPNSPIPQFPNFKL